MKRLKLKKGVSPEGEQALFGNGQRTEHRMVVIQEGADEIVKRLLLKIHGLVGREAEFTQAVLEVIRTQNPEWEVRTPAPLLIEIVDGEVNKGINLRNVFAACNAAPEDEVGIIQRLVRSISTAEESADESVALKNVLPVFRHDNAAKSGEFAVPMNPDLILRYAVDTEDAMTFPNRDISIELGLTMDELHSEAVQNLAAKFRQVSFESLGEGVCRPLADGNYETSLILIPGLWNKMAHGVKGEFVYGLPCRGTLLFCDSADGKALRHLRERTKWNFVKSAYAISDKLFVWRDGKLEVFKGK